jgi:hypothetical protein
MFLPSQQTSKKRTWSDVSGDAMNRCNTASCHRWRFRDHSPSLFVVTKLESGSLGASRAKKTCVLVSLSYIVSAPHPSLAILDFLPL